jgi:hypothetical protein
MAIYNDINYYKRKLKEVLPNLKGKIKDVLRIYDLIERIEHYVKELYEHKE